MMKQEFTYSLRESTPEFRFAGLVYSVPAQKFQTLHNFGIEAVRLDSGVFFSIKCSIAECGRYILKRVCEVCITVSNFVRRAIRILQRSFPGFARQRISKQTTFLSCCVFRC